ncbi:uncharacterized protein LOC143292352 [Babylonia areolata]|uniref:uncharacterized protein LOC143292352 n=1 Tax=Babylonia areolata TaxID=304850 RepID=UPI003FD33400
MRGEQRWLAWNGARYMRGEQRWLAWKSGGCTRHRGMSQGEGAAQCRELCHKAGRHGRPSGRRRWLGRLRQLPWVVWATLLWASFIHTAATPSPTHAPSKSTSQPLTVPPSHPNNFLTVAGQDPYARPHTAPRPHGRSPGEVQGGEVREAEVMYHLYKNGRQGSASYRKASTVFMVRLFNDLIRGLSARGVGVGVGRGRGRTNASDSDHQPVTDTIRSFSAQGAGVALNRALASTLKGNNGHHHFLEHMEMSLSTFWSI